MSRGLALGSVWSYEDPWVVRGGTEAGGMGQVLGSPVSHFADGWVPVQVSR